MLLSNVANSTGLSKLSHDIFPHKSAVIWQTSTGIDYRYLLHNLSLHYFVFFLHVLNDTYMVWSHWVFVPTAKFLQSNQIAERAITTYWHPVSLISRISSMSHTYQALPSASMSNGTRIFIWRTLFWTKSLRRVQLANCPCASGWGSTLEPGSKLGDQVVDIQLRTAVFEAAGACQRE